MVYGSNRPRIRISILFGIAIFLLCCVCGNRWDAQTSIVPALLFLVGMLLVGIATLGRAWCSLYIAGYKTSTLVTQGPYSISRNPLYLFSLIGVIGVGLCSETLLIPAILTIAFALYYPAVIRQEEKTLLEVHGEAFRAYMTTTPKFFPRFSSLCEPKEYQVNPKIFRKHISESMLFVWVVGMLEVVEALHNLHVLPVWLKTY